MPKTLNILFLGAGKRMSLFERMVAACDKEGTQARLLSYENSRFVPVVDLAQIVIGLPWNDPRFSEHLLATVAERHVDVIIPCMDAATVKLSELAPGISKMGCWPVVSSAEICRTFENKKLAERWFVGHDIPTPVWDKNTPYPWIVKRIHGFASRGQFNIHNQEEFDALQGNINPEEHLIQPFISGIEYTIDAYVSRAREMLGCVTRRRLEVVDGEVVRSVTIRKAALIEQSHRILSLGGFQGPITLQAIQQDDRFWFIEINARFGGGVILSMEAGADYARLIVREALGLPVEPVTWKEDVLMMRAHREVFHQGYKHDDHR